MPRNHALLAFGAIAVGWLILTLTIWRLYPDQPPARLLVAVGVGLVAWGLLWFPMAHLHRLRAPEAHQAREGPEMGPVWRRSGWGALWASALATLFLQRALRLEWALLFGLLLLGAELLWTATEPAPEPEPPLAARRRSGRR